MASKFYYQAEVRHGGLNKYRIVKAETKYELNQKVTALQSQWDEQWAKRCDTEEKKREKQQILRNHEECLAFANEMTRDAESSQANLDTILSNSLNPVPLDANKLKDFSVYSVQPPRRPNVIALPREPQLKDTVYSPKIPFLTKISKKKTELFQQHLQDQFNSDHTAWELSKKNIETQHEKNENEYNKNYEKWQMDLMLSKIYNPRKT